MNHNRRHLLKTTGALSVLIAAGVISAEQAFASVDPRAAFGAKTLAEMLSMVGGTAVSNAEITIIAPDIAENGAVVPVGIISALPNTQEMYIFVEKNPVPLAAIFKLPEGTEGMINSRVKLGQSTDVVIVVKANDQLYVARKEIKVTLGGCGG